MDSHTHAHVHTRAISTRAVKKGTKRDKGASVRAAASEAGVEGGREELGPGGTPMLHPFPVLQPLPPLSPRPLLQCPTVSLWRTKKVTEHARGGRRFCMN